MLKIKITISILLLIIFSAFTSSKEKMETKKEKDKDKEKEKEKMPISIKIKTNLNKENSENTENTTTPKFKIFDDDSNPFKNLKTDELKKILGFKTLTQKENKGAKRETIKNFDGKTLEKIKNLPKNFMTTDKWPECGSYVKSQGYCSSCWAFAAAEVLQDRYCIKMGYPVPNFSVQEMISCDFKNFNCQGGDLEQAWKFLQEKGTVTERCFPYGNKYEPKVKRCSKLCNNGRRKLYIWSKYYKKFDNSDEIKLEIIENGPIMTGFEVYMDFLEYKSGIYSKSKNTEFLGGHAVKLVGWGVENGVEYWIAKNTWGTSWGENGFFRFKMNHCCQFEENAITGYAY